MIFFEDFIEKHPLSLLQKIEIAVELAGVLKEAHQAGRVHGSLDPQKIRRSPEGKWQILDFGISRPAFQNPDSLSNDFLQEDLPYCLDPEQCNGMPATFASDIYSLGALFYWLLAQRYPFPQENPLELLHCHLYETPRSLEQHEGPYPFRELIFRMLDKDPQCRPSISQVFEALTALPSAPELSPTPVSPPNLWPLRLALIGLGLLLLLNLPFVQKQWQGNWEDFYWTSGKSVKLYLKNGEILQGLKIDPQEKYEEGKVYLRQAQGKIKAVSQEDILREEEVWTSK
jgi:serine/threonine protein kinase